MRESHEESDGQDSEFDLDAEDSEAAKRKKKKRKLKKRVFDVLPNYPIKRGRISMESMLPVIDSPSKDTKKVLQKEVQDYVLRYKHNFEMIYPSIGQLVCFFMLKSADLTKNKMDQILPSPSVSSCSIVSIDEDIEKVFILSCLHSVRIVDPKIISSRYERKCYFVHSEFDIVESANKAFEYVRNSYNRHETLKPLEEFCEEVVGLLSRRFHADRPFVSPVVACLDFLEMRKDYIIAESKRKAVLSGGEPGSFSHSLIDPEFFLQPVPSVDVLTFDVPKDFIKKYSMHLKSKGTDSIFEYDEERSVSFSASMKVLHSSTSSNKFMSFLNINTRSSRTKPQPEDIVTLLGYNSIKFESSLEEKDMYRKSHNLKIHKYIDAEFMNENLSIGFCVVKKVSLNILTFKGNTSEGSSGAPILNENLELIGVNFGCYYDYQEDQAIHEKYYSEETEETKDKKKSKSKRGLTVNITGKKNQTAGQKLNIAKKRATSIDDGTRKREEARHKTKCLHKDDIYQFDIEIYEPGHNEHSETLKNRNLAIAINHPVIQMWVKKRAVKRKEKSISIGSDEEYNDPYGGARRANVSFKGIANAKQVKKDKVGTKDVFGRRTFSQFSKRK